MRYPARPNKDRGYMDPEANLFSKILNTELHFVNPLLDSKNLLPIFLNTTVLFFKDATNFQADSYKIKFCIVR